MAHDSRSFRVPELPDTYFTLSFEDVDALFGKLLEHFKVDGGVIKRPEGVEATTSALDLIFEQLRVSRVRCALKQEQAQDQSTGTNRVDAEELVEVASASDDANAGARRGRKRRKIDDAVVASAAAGDDDTDMPDAFKQEIGWNTIEESIDVIRGDAWTVPADPVLEYALTQHGERLAAQKGVPGIPADYKTLPYDLALHIIDYTDDYGLLDNSTGQFRFREVLGRFRRDQERRLQLVFRSLVLEHTDAAATVADEGRRPLFGELWQFVMRNVVSLYVRCSAEGRVELDGAPTGFLEWILPHASATTMPRLRSVRIDDAFIDEIITSRDWQSNRYIDERVTALQHWKPHDAKRLLESGALPNLKSLDINDCVGEHDRDGVYIPIIDDQALSRCSRLRNLRGTVRCSEDVDLLVQTARSHPADIKELHVDIDSIEAGGDEPRAVWFDGLRESRSCLRTLSMTATDPQELQRCPALPPAITELFLLDDVTLESLDGILHAKTLRAVVLNKLKFESCRLELLLDLPMLDELELEDADLEHEPVGFSPKLRDVTVKLVAGGKLKYLILRLYQGPGRHSIRDEDIEALCALESGRLREFGLTLRNKCDLSEPADIDTVISGITSRSLLALCANRYVHGAWFVVPGLAICARLARRILDLQLLDYLSIDVYN